MAKNKWPGGTLLAPVPPVLVSCGSVDSPNVCTAAWCGIVCSTPPLTYVSLRPQRYSHGLIRESGEFVINLPTAALARAVDWCGVKSGRDTDKFSACGLSAVPGFAVSAPLVAESPLGLECRVSQVLELGSHHMFLARIEAVAVDESLIDKTGKLQLARAGLLAYAHGDYYALGEKLGGFGWSVRRKKGKSAQASIKCEGKRPAKQERS